MARIHELNGEYRQLRAVLFLAATNLALMLSLWVADQFLDRRECRAAVEQVKTR